MDDLQGLSDDIEAAFREAETRENIPIRVDGPAIVFVLRYEGPHEYYVQGAWWQVLDSLPKAQRDAAVMLGDLIGLPTTT